MSKTKTEEQPVAVQTFPSTLPAKLDTLNNFKSLKRITRDVANITKLGEAIICCQSELYTIEIESKFTPGTKQPVYAVDCLDCLRGDEYVLLCGAVLASSLNRAGGPLAGRYFAIRSGEIAPGKRYRKVDVVELERVE